MAEIPLLLMDETARLKLLAPLNNLYVRNFWNSYNRWKADRQEELTSSTRRRVGNFINDPLILEIVGQSETTVDFRKIMDERKILLVKLSRRHELISSLVGSVIVGQIANAAFSREDTPEDQRIQFNLFADEYQRFSTPVFAELLAEVRKYKIATCVAHQWRGQLDHANRGATLNAANRVVYQVSGEDAEELAKQFDATPPPAREEDIEIIDGTEPILTPVKDVVGHLLTKGGHPNDVVNQFVNDLLHQFKRQDDVDHTHLVDNLNLLFYQAMKGNNTTKFMFNPALVHVFGIASNPGFSEYTLVFNPYQGRDSDLYIFENPNVYAPARQALQLLWSASPGSWQEQQAMQTIDASAKTYLRDTHLKQLYAAMNMAKNGQNIQQSWYYIDANLVEWETVDNPSYSRYAPTSIQLPKVGQEWKFYREADLMQFIEAEIQPWRDTFLRFIRELKEVCQALADDPIRERSGLEQPRKRIQHIVHAQQTHADKQAEIASSLANPPIPYTARAKLGTKEYTIQALPFRQPDASDVVATRRDRIVANTRKQYCKKREEVVKEIEARQNELMKSAPPKPGTKREE